MGLSNIRSFHVFCSWKAFSQVFFNDFVKDGCYKERDRQRKHEASKALTVPCGRTLYSVFSGSTLHEHGTKRGVLFSPFIQFSHKFNSIATGDVFDDSCTTPTVAFWIPTPDHTVFSKPSSLNKQSSTFSLSVR